MTDQLPNMPPGGFSPPGGGGGGGSPFGSSTPPPTFFGGGGVASSFDPGAFPPPESAAPSPVMPVVTSGGSTFPPSSGQSSGPQASSQNPCNTIASCATQYAKRATETVTAVVSDMGKALADAVKVGSAESAPFDRTALGSIAQTTKAFGDVYGLSPEDSTQIAKAVAGACAQEAGGCNPDVKHPGSQYQGLPQTNPLGAKENANTFKFFADNEYVAMSDDSRAQFKYLADRYDSLVAQGKDPRRDPEVAGGMIVAQGFNVKDASGQGSGQSPALAAADYARGADGTIDPLKAAAVLQTAQICPSCVSDYARDPKATLSRTQAGLLNSKANAVPVKEGQPITRAFDAMLASKKAYGPTFAKGINAQTLAMANPSPTYIEPQVAYTMGNVGSTQYPSPLAYASADTRGGSPAPFPGSPGAGTGSDYSNPALAYRMPENIGRSTFSPSVTKTSFAQGKGVSFNGSGVTVNPSSYSPRFQSLVGRLVQMGGSFAGGPTPLFTQGSVPSQAIGGIGGSPSAPAFMQQSYYGQPTASAPKPSYSFTDPVARPYTMPSLAPVSVTPQSFAGASRINPLAGGVAPGQFPPSLQSSQPSYAPYSGGPTPLFTQGSVPSQALGSISGGNAQTPTFAGGSPQNPYGQLGPSVYPASQFSQTTPGSSFSPSVAPVSASQYFRGDLQLTGPTTPGTQTGYTYTDPIARLYSMSALQQPQGSPATGGSAQTLQQALAYKNPLPYAYSMSGLPVSAQPSYAPYSGGPTPLFTQGSVPSQALGSISGGNAQTPTFAGGGNTGAPALNTTQYTLPPGLGGSTQGGYGQLGPSTYPAAQFAQQTPGTGFSPSVAPVSASQYFQGNLQLQSPSGAVTPTSFTSASQINPLAGGGLTGQFLPGLQSAPPAGSLPVFAQGSVPSQALGSISGGNAQTPTFAGGGNTGAPALNTTQYRLPDSLGGSTQGAYGQLQSSPPVSGADRVSPDLAYQYAQQETQRVQARDYAASLYNQTLNGKSAPLAITPSSGMWNRYMDIGAAELGKPASVASPSSPSAPGVPLPPTRPESFAPAASRTFEQNLGFGSRGQSVAALQQRLINEGYLKLVHGPSGYYGLLTQNAIIRYQRDHGVRQTGFTGPVTRCNLNGGTYYSSSASCRY